MKIAHISDLHIGRDSIATAAAARLAVHLSRASDVDWVCCTGDLTHNGKVEEGRKFAELFAPLRHKLTVVPGNHDCCTDNIAAVLSKGDCWVREGVSGQLRMVCIDSTQPMNHTMAFAHGQLTNETAERVLQLVDAASPTQSVLVLIHHHLIRTTPDDVFELMSDFQRLPFAGHLRGGEALAERLVGRVAAVLHGHKHREGVHHIDKELPVVNAGSTTGLSRYRVLAVLGNLVTEEQWRSF